MSISKILCVLSMMLLASCAGQQTDSPGKGSSGSNTPGTRSTTTGSGEANDRELLGANATSSRLGGGPKVDEYDVTQEQVDQKQIDRFLRARCLTLGRALSQLTTDDAQLRELAENDIAALLDSDNARIAQAAQQAELDRAAGREPKAASGLVVPRYIAAMLREPKEKWDNRWLAIQGQLLQLTYRLETLDLDTWKVTIGQMMQLGSEGRQNLAVQMVLRLRLAHPEFRDYAKDVLVGFVPEEAVEPLIAATHVDIHDQPGVFPRQTASVLAQIGKKAVPQILEVFKARDGTHLPGSDGNWKVRRYLIDALGQIGDAEAVDVLITELESCKFKGDDRRFLYASVIVQALGKIKDKRAVPAIVKEWKRYADPSEFVETARPALFLLTRKIYSHPSEVKE